MSRSTTTTRSDEEPQCDDGEPIEPTNADATAPAVDSDPIDRATEPIDAGATDATDSIDTVTAELNALRDRIADLESELDRKDDRIAALEAASDRKDDRIAELETELGRVQEASDRANDAIHRSDDTDTETAQRSDRLGADADWQPIVARLEAHEKKLAANKERIAALQSRELQTGAHLREETVDRCAIDVPDDRLERVRKDDGDRYLRLPERDDPLGRGGDVTLAHGDLLPFQQLARLDDDMLRSTTSALPTRLAVALWRARTDPTVGDNPWNTGGGSVREYLTAGEMKHWIRRQESGVSDTYAKKLVSRTIDALCDLSTHRLAIERTTQRKNGLEYTERRVLLPADADIPGETIGDG